MESRAVEITVGIVAAAGMAVLFMLSMKVSNLSTLTADEGYQLITRFENVGSLKVRSPVTVAGVRIGRVSGIGFDNEDYMAVVHLNILPQYNNLPRDTSASIYTAGLLGEQYVSLRPGHDEISLKDGDEIGDSQPAIVIEDLIGKVLFGDKSEEGGEK
jgi:phospholipid/cholesterol/gamma-HCH transport system substrate-binding protein